MKKAVVILVILLGWSVLFAQDKMLIHKSGETIEVSVAETDSIYFTDDATIIHFAVSGNLMNYPVSEVDSITFNITSDSTILIHYNGAGVTVINPFSDLGVSIEVAGADVTVNSTVDFNGLNLVLSGSTDDGMIKIYSEKRILLALNGVEITNPDGPAINIQSDKRITVQLPDESESILTDGPVYGDPPIGGNGEPEDQDACFFSEGQLVFTGSGGLQINGYGTAQHGLNSDDYIRIESGNVVVASAVMDGLHAKDGFYLYGGTLNVSSSGDGIDAASGIIEITGGNLTISSVEDDVAGLKSDSTILISGGTIDIDVNGDQSKGIKSDQDITLAGGEITISVSGGVVLEPLGSGYEPAYSSAINSDTLVLIDGSVINITANGEAARGITCDGNIMVNSGTIEIALTGDGDTYTNPEGDTDAYHGSCLNSNGSISVFGGELTLSHSGDGGKGISADNEFNFGSEGTDPLLDITTTGQKITIQGGGQGIYDEAKAVTTDGAIAIGSGNLIIHSADDALKSTVSITINGGIVDITQSKEGIESPNIILNDGEVNLVSTDDGFNATYGNGGEANDGSLLQINGGYAYLNSSNGDPMDSNGNIQINGGITVVHGPQSAPEVGMDVNGTCLISGGFLVVSGTNSNMTEGASQSSTQHSVLLRTNQSVPANTIFHIEDAAGNSLLNFKPVRTYYSIIFSSSELSAGTTYKVYTGGTCTGTLLNGLYTGGTYSGGTLKTTFTLSGMAPTVWF
jgi:trimeric autotransporter adhesin